MKKCILAALLLCCFGTPLFAASNIQFPWLFNGETKKSKLVVGLAFETQENTFPEQVERSIEQDTNGEERIYGKNRSSSNSLTCEGVMVGYQLKNLALFYLIAGYAEAEVDFYLNDEMTDSKNAYTTSTTFNADPFFFYGVGISAQPVNKKVYENHTLYLGLDLKYRFFDFDAEKRVGSADTEWYGLEYASKLHEVQLSAVGAMDGFSWNPFTKLTLSFTPYIGCKVSHFFADENFSDSGNVASNYEFQNDPIIYEGDIATASHISFFAGVGIGLTDKIIVGLETRSGDEDGYAFNLSFKF